MCVLGEPAGIEIEWNAGLSRDSAHFFYICHRYGLPARRVVRDRQHDQRDALRAVLGDELLERRCIHIALERERRVEVLGLEARQVDGLASAVLDIGPRRVEMGVVGHDRFLVDHDAEQDVLGRPALVRRDDLRKAEDLFDRVPEPIPAAGAGVGLIAAHERRPRVGRHRARSRIRQKIDDDVFGSQQKSVVVRRPDQLAALLARGELYGLDHLDPVRLDDGLHTTTLVTDETNSDTY